MNLYLVSGLELDLFSKFEYPYIYWYLCEVVLNWQISTLNRLDNFLQSNELNFPSKKDSKFKQNYSFIKINYFKSESKK